MKPLHRLTHSAKATSWLIASLAILLLLSRASAVEFSSLEFAGKRVIVCRVNVLKERLQLFHRDEMSRPFKRFETLANWLKARGQKLVFGMNAGMYHADFSAVGLSVINRQQLTPLNTANAEGNFFLKPNGVFLVSVAGARVVESPEYPRVNDDVILATQSGPLLVHAGKIHPAFNANSESRLLRNGVGVPTADTAVFAITETPVNFYEFATMFRDRLGCADALFLDGTVSSLHSTRLNRSDFKMDLGPMIGIAE